MHFLTLGVAPLFLMAGSGSAPVTFLDETFDDANWQSSSLVVGPGSATGSGAQAQEGNPAPARRVTHVISAGGVNTTVWTPHTKIDAVYDPSLAGPIDTLAISIDFTGPSVQRVYGSIRQDSRTYVNYPTNWLTGGTSWGSFGPSVHPEEDFVEQLSDGSFALDSHPDFSSSGLPMTFGFLTGNTSAGNNTLVADYDNWRFDVNGVPSTSVVRLGIPANPNALLPGSTPGPVIGSTWDPVIDHLTFLPGATTDVAFYSMSAANLPTDFGTLLCNGVFSVHSVPAGTPFAFVVPDKTALIGAEFCLQGGSVELSGGALTNALDVTVGSF